MRRPVFLIFYTILNILIVRDFIQLISMVEQEKNKKNMSQNGDNLGSSESNFWWIEKFKINNEEQKPIQNFISQANAQEKSRVPREEIKLEKLEINTKPIEEKKETVVLWESGIFDGIKSKYHDQYWKIFLISFFVILITGLASLVLRLYSRYLYFASQPVLDTAYETYVNTYKQGQQFFDKIFYINTYQKYLSLSIMGTGEESNLDKVIQDKTLSYVQKKDIIQQAISSFSTIFVSNNQKLTLLKESISKYGFFSQEIYDMMQNQSYSTSIKNYLLSLEIIKFSSAIKVFSYLDTFISSLSNALRIPMTQVETNMQTLTDRGEKDILIYLNNCYLNPYEIDYDCNLVGDFDRYYKSIDKEKNPPDTNFFKKMMYYVDTKLEQTDLPSFSIIFNKYNPTQKEISFTVDVNTFKQDEIALIKKWIINPHIFILSNLLNLIKQSIFVVSENIDAKSIKINPKIIKIGSSVFQVNNSTMNFVLPIQKWSEREISDYIDPIFISLP